MFRDKERKLRIFLVRWSLVLALITLSVVVQILNMKYLSGEFVGITKFGKIYLIK